MHTLDDFYHPGAHGSHLCLVTEVLGEDVQGLATKFQNHVLPIAAVNSYGSVVFFSSAVDMCFDLMVGRS